MTLEPLSEIAGYIEQNDKRDKVGQKPKNATLLEHWFFGFHLNLLSPNITETCVRVK